MPLNLGIPMVFEWVCHKLHLNVARLHKSQMPMHTSPSNLTCAIFTHKRVGPGHKTSQTSLPSHCCCDVTGEEEGCCWGAELLCREVGLPTPKLLEA